MKDHHCNVEEALQIHKDLKSKKSIAMHWGTFQLTDEPMDEPVKLLKKLTAEKKLLSDEVGTEASLIAKNKNLRKLVHSFQINCAYKPPKKFKGSCLDGRDITYKIIPDADFKFFITANVNVRARRRFNELKKLKRRISYAEVLKSIKKRDKSDYNRRISPLKKTRDSVLINTSNLSKRACFLKIKKIIDKKLIINGNL